MRKRVRPLDERGLEIVAIQTERLGDLIVATPALRNVRASLPDAHITLVCPPALAGVLQGWDAVDEIVPFDPAWKTNRRREFAAAMRRRCFDVSVALTSNWSAYRLGRTIAAPRRAGVVYGANLLPSLVAPLFLTDTVRIWIFGQPASDATVLHRAEELLRMNAALGLRADRVPFELSLPAEHRLRARQLLHEAGVASPVVFHAAGRWLQDGWTPSDIVALAQALRDQLTVPLILTAGPSDQKCVDAFRGVDRIFVVRGLAFGEWAAVLEHASIVVTHDTSAVHVASAVRRPVVAVYQPNGFAVQSRQWAPWMVPQRVLRKAAPAATVRHVCDATASLLAECGARSAG